VGGGAEGLSVAVAICGAFGLLAGVLFLVAARTYPEDAQKVKNEVIMAE
jgi:hypothetical protein